MSQPQSKSTPSEQRKKLLAAALLVALLAVALMNAFSPSDSEAIDSLASAQPASGAAAPAVPAPSVPVVTAVTLRDGAASFGVAQQPMATLPEVHLDLILEANPFFNAEAARQTAEAFAKTKASQLLISAGIDGAVTPQATVAELLTAQAGSLSAIVSGTERPAVLIGDRVYYEQDVVADRWQIVSIRPNSVVVHPVESPTNEIN
ncbi:MAG: hypothetical protein KF752_13010 [Pirellulaceae bacterium]|nr:hypothetical protein [Pirellulaceae bacterium]